MRPTRFSTRMRNSTRSQRSAAMERRNRAENELLGRQLASIAETLAAASARRDEEVRMRFVERVKSAHRVWVAGGESMESARTGEDEEGVGGEGGGMGPDMKDFDFGSGAGVEQGEGSSEVTLRGGHGSDQEDSKEMLAAFDHEISSPAAQKYEQTGDMSPQANQYIHVDTTDDDIRKMLAELDGGVPAGDAARCDTLDNLYSGRLLAEFDSALSAADSAADPVKTDDDPKKMLAELDGRGVTAAELKGQSAEQLELDLQDMLADLERQTAHQKRDTTDRGEEALEALHRSLMGLPSPRPAAQHTPTLQPSSPQPAPLEAFTQPSPAFEHTAEMTPADLAPPVVPYAIAIQLEIGGWEWERAQAWTTYLFSSGLNGHKACQEKDKIVQQATEELDEVIRVALVGDERYQGKASIAARPRRVVVSNIAADAGKDDLEAFFSRHRFVV